MRPKLMKIIQKMKKKFYSFLLPCQKMIYQKVFITLIHHTGLQIKHKV